MARMGHHPACVRMTGIQLLVASFAFDTENNSSVCVHDRRAGGKRVWSGLGVERAMGESAGCG